MEKLKKKRTTQRTAFTKALKAYDDTIKDGSPAAEITVAYKILAEKMSELDKTMEKIFDALYDSSTATEDDIQQELDEADAYKRKFLSAEYAETTRITQQFAPPSMPSTTNPDSKRAFKLPKIELYKFSGNVREWLTFWSLFKKIHEDDEMEKEDKYRYLMQAVVPDSRAANLVFGYPPTAANYDLVIESLTNRFGREDLQIEVYVRELLQLVLQNMMRSGERMLLSTLYDKIDSYLKALSTFGVTTDKCASMLFPLVESSLPEELLRVWQRTYTTAIGAQNGTGNSAEDKLNQLMKFLEGEVQNESRISMALEGFDLKEEKKECHEKPAKAAGKDRPTATDLVATNRTNYREYSCVFCESKDHLSPQCIEAKKLSLADRKTQAREKNACFNCLKIGHIGFKCRGNQRCGTCTRRHVDLMCPDEKCEKTETDSRTESNKDSVGLMNECSLASVEDNSEVLLQTIKVKLLGETGSVTVRAIIDSGSQHSYVTENVIKQLGCKPTRKVAMDHYVFGGGGSKDVMHQEYLLFVSSMDSKFKCHLKVFNQDTICTRIPPVSRGPWCDELKSQNIELTDIGGKDESVALLIGADIAGKLKTGKIHQLQCGLTACETRLGWTLTGKVATAGNKQTAAITAISMHVSSCEVKDLWSLDVLGIRDPIQQKTRKEQDDEARTDFVKMLKTNSEGRYEASLPFLETHPPLGDNKAIALHRLKTTKDELIKENLLGVYDGVPQEWLAEGIIERVPKEQEETWGHYLPHRPVIKENSTTPVRPVFDASAKEGPSPALNECLQTGENLIELVPSILLRFREGLIGVVSDIKKAFLQISVSPSDRDFLRFLWYDDVGNIIILRHCRIVFGLCCSPFALGTTIYSHLQSILKYLSTSKNLMVHNFTEKMITKLSRSFYVDNCATSVDSIEELHAFISESKRAMELAKFDLRGWEFPGDGLPNAQTPVLGIIWDKSADTLSLNVPIPNEFSAGSITKREILSWANRVFDPLGFACPFTLLPRLLLQETWQDEYTWDDPVTVDIQKRFLKWVTELQELRKVRVPRKLIGTREEIRNISLHTFCDASHLAYAAVIFLRIERGESVDVIFVQAKTRVAPCKKENGPRKESQTQSAQENLRPATARLELLAATIGVRLASSVIKSLNLSNVRKYYWSDSSTVLAWIRRRKNWASFVWNRVGGIRALSETDEWFYIPGSLNPADLPSRGCTVNQLLASEWWKGPAFLRRPFESWPGGEITYNEVEVNNELKKGAEATEVSSQPSTNLIASTDRVNSLIEKYSSYSKLLKMIAWLARFCDNCRASKDNRRKGCMSVSEIDQAEVKLLKHVQMEKFRDSQSISHLEPFVDDAGLIRLKSKLFLRNDSYTFRCPVVLPCDHKVTLLLIREKHVQLNHAGVQITLNKLRENFWILRGRKTVKDIIEKCVDCRRFDAKSLTSAPTPLPMNRVRDAAVFEVVGVDFAGPLYLKSSQKTWICIFTCAVFRAVHLELANSLDIASLIMAIRRFIARRGRPSFIYSDNGTNFKGLNEMLKKVNFEKLAEEMTAQRIQWVFNPPAAAWWGGFWERLIRVLKGLLRRTLKKSNLNYEEMLTILTDCESVMNARPITFISDNGSDFMPLTPAHFLQEIQEVGTVDLDKLEESDFGKRYLYRQKVKQDLRDRFRIEYLGALSYQKDKNKNKNERELNVGDVVLVGFDNAKRMNWPLARVKEVFRGNDGNIRVVRLSTASGELIRPIQRIYPLEIKVSGDESSIQRFDRDQIPGQLRVNNETMNRVSSDSELLDSKDVVTRSGRVSKKPLRLQYPQSKRNS